MRKLGGLALALAAVSAGGCVGTGKYQASVAEADTWKGKARGLETELAARAGELAGARKDLEGVRKELEAAKADKAASAQAWASLEADLRTRLAASEEKLQASEAQVASLKGSVSQLQQASESSKSELSRKLSALVAEKDEVAQKLAESQASLASLRAAKDAQIAELTRKLTGALEEKTQLEAAKGQLEAAKAQAEAARSEVEKAKEAELSKVKQSYEDLASNLKAEIAAGEVKLTQLQGRLTVQLIDRILFDSGSADIKPAGRKVLSRIGKLLNEVPNRDVRIEGHTDNVPISDELRSVYPSNWELSTARATSVARFLQDASKIDPKRLIAAGYGEFRPVAPNDKPESRALNRRIELVLIAKD